MWTDGDWLWLGGVLGLMILGTHLLNKRVNSLSEDIRLVAEDPVLYRAKHAVSGGHYTIEETP